MLPKDLPNFLRIQPTDTTNGELIGNSVKAGTFGESKFLNNLKSFPAPIAGEEQVCFTSGLCLNVPVFSAGTTAETAGGLGGGATEKYVYVLQQISDQLEADLGTDDPFILMVTELAKQGHVLGNSEQGYINATSAHNAKYGIFEYKYATEVQDMININKASVKNKISTYDAKWQEVQDHITANPSLLSNYPEVKDIID